MKDERINFSVWVVTRACNIQALVFFTKKIQKVLIHRIKNQSYAPPIIIQQTTCLANKIDIYQNTAANDFLLHENKGECATFSKIKLATGFFSCNEKIDWQMQLKDPEDQEALHRWNFFITELSTLKGERKSNDLLPWVQSCINDWIDAFQDELKDPAQFASMPRWDSYTVGERISNAVIVYYYYKKKPNKKIQQALINMGVYLAGHLEYHRENFKRKWTQRT